MGPAFAPCSCVQERARAGLRAMPRVQERGRRRVAARRALVTRRPRRTNELDARGLRMFRASTRGFVQVGETGPVAGAIPCWGRCLGVEHPRAGRRRHAARAPRRLNLLVEHLGGVESPCGLPELWATRWTGLLAQLDVASRPSARCRRKSEGKNQTSENYVAGCSVWASMGRNPFRAGTSPLGRPRPSDGSGLGGLLNPGPLTSC
jgi:hypothetical protein